MTFICSECGRRIDPDRVHRVDGKAYPDGIGCRLKDPEATIYNLCYRTDFGLEWPVKGGAYDA